MTDEQMVEATSHLPAIDFDALSDEMKATMASFGVIPADIGVAPVPTLTHKYSLDEVCVLTTEIKDEHGETIRKVKGHSGPMVYLSTAEESDSTRKGFTNRYEETRGFWVYTVWHFDLSIVSRNYPSGTQGKIVVTHGIPKEGPPTDLAQFIATLSPGNYFQVAAVETSSGKRIFQPVKVQ